MFWSEASRTKIMGADSNAPIGSIYDLSELPLKAPAVVTAAPAAEKKNGENHSPNKRK